jgi:MFS transporter, PHS family, inorganic phosphate transporter
MYGVELIIMIAATFSLSIAGSGPAVSIIGVTIFWRIVLGVGVGGDYPTSSIITSEFATVRWRGAMMAAVFFNQGLGQFVAALVSFICTARYKDFLRDTTCDANCQYALDQSWRILYGLGILPACVALYFRLTIPETVRYTLDVKVDEEGAVDDARRWVNGERVWARRNRLPRNRRGQLLPKATLRDFLKYFGTWETGKVLLGTAGSWALLDVAFVHKAPFGWN